jgi:hypothetical protein
MEFDVSEKDSAIKEEYEGKVEEKKKEKEERKRRKKKKKISQQCNSN